jgi:hypothetical protein
LSGLGLSHRLLQASDLLSQLGVFLLQF